MIDRNAVWLITGCSTGFGRTIAECVLEKGYRAVATARNPAQVADLWERYPDRALALPLDVNKPDQVRSVVRQAEEKFGSIDVLVNNAGYGYLASIEEGEIDEIRAMFETNFFGALTMMQAALPKMRERRQGHVVNVTSVGGLVSFAATGFYHASKYALEGLSESVGLEVAPFGIKVTIVEPGPFRTDWPGRSLRQSKRRLPEYEETSGKRRDSTVASSGNQPGDPARAAAAIVAAVEADEPPLHLLLGQPALNMARAKLDALGRNFDTWERTTVEADFPEFRNT